MRFHVYILFSESLDRYYIGFTENLTGRLDRHLQSKKGFTSKAKDWELLYSEDFKLKSEAIERERQIKKWKSRKMIESLISNR